MSVGWLVGWYVGWLVAWLVCRLVGCLVGMSVGWLVGWLVSLGQNQGAEIVILCNLEVSVKIQNFPGVVGPLDPLGEACTLASLCHCLASLRIVFSGFTFAHSHARLFFPPFLCVSLLGFGNSDILRELLLISLKMLSSSLFLSVD